MSSTMVTEDVVRGIKVPPSTRSFSPVRNDELLDMVEDVAGQFDLAMENGKFTLSNKNHRMFASFDLRGQNTMDGDIIFQLGIRNSCDKTITAGVCFGSKVFVCSNLMFVAYGDNEYGIRGRTSHKHTVNVENVLYDRLMDSFSQFEKVKEWQTRFYVALHNRHLRREKAYENIIKAARADILNKKDILEVADYWDWQAREPEQRVREFNGVERTWHPEFQGRDGYSLLNAYTEINKTKQERNFGVAATKSMSLVKFLHQTLVPNLN